MNKVYSIDEIKTIIAPIATRHRLNRVYLFGSYANGNASHHSDIDFCVDVPENTGLFELGGLYIDLKNAFNKEIDVITINSLKNNKNPKFVTNVNKENILIYEDDGKRC